MAQRLWVELLGPVRVWLDGVQAPLRANRLQGLLDVLATRRDSVVSRGELVDALWGDHPPASAENAVHVYVSRLRRILEPDRAARAPGRLLVSVGSGYQLQLKAGQLDATAFHTNRDRALRLRAIGDLAGAARSFDDALALWRGIPWSGVPGPFAEIERARLEELRLTIVEDRADALEQAGERPEALRRLVDFTCTPRMPAIGCWHRSVHRSS